MLTVDRFYDYQKKAVNIQCSHRESALWLDMGLGKTAITLTSIAHLLGTGYLRGVLIVAPIRVCRLVWRQEALKWAHTHHLTFNMIMGTKDQRTRALLRKADVYLINYENLRWLAETLQTYFIKKDKPLPFDGMVWDEISKMKNSSTNRVKAIMKVLPHFKWKTGLTGTPAANGYADLHGQYLVLDEGKRLGTSKTAFRNRFYYKSGPYKYKAFDTTETEIQALIGDITLQMAAEDYNPLPDLLVNDVMIDLPDSVRQKYEQLEKEFFFYLDSGEGVEVFNAAALTNKCLAKGTEVLTDKGWMRIEDYRDERVWDGEEWVNTSGLLDQGYKKTIMCWGVGMTPDHKVMTDSGWVTAEDIVNGEPGKRYDRYKVRLPYGYRESGEQTYYGYISSCIMEGAMRLWKRVNNAWTESSSQYTSNKIMRMQTSGGDIKCNRVAWDDRTTPLGFLVQYAIKMQQSQRQRLRELRRTWNKSLRKMEQFFSGILEGHGCYVQGRADYRTHEQQRGLYTRELSVAQYEKAVRQQENKCLYPYPNRHNNCFAGSTTVQPQTDHYLQAVGERVERGRPNSSGKNKVYDILNAGPKHRFTVRGKDGQVFLSHNCLQFSNGAVYPMPGLPMWEPVHDLKLEALEDIIEEANGQPVLCAYAYRSDAERIMQKFRQLRPINLTDCKTDGSLRGAMARWKEGDCALMIGHPASMGHGVDGLQDAGHIMVWFGLNWSLDLYEQMNARLRRQGQAVPVICHRILTSGTLDMVQAEALSEKSTTQKSLRAAIKRYRDKKNPA